MLKILKFRPAKQCVECWHSEKNTMPLSAKYLSQVIINFSKCKIQKDIIIWCKEKKNLNPYRSWPNKKAIVNEAYPRTIERSLAAYIVTIIPIT